MKMPKGQQDTTDPVLMWLTLARTVNSLQMNVPCWQHWVCHHLWEMSTPPHLFSGRAKTTKSLLRTLHGISWNHENAKGPQRHQGPNSDVVDAGKDSEFTVHIKRYIAHCFVFSSAIVFKFRLAFLPRKGRTTATTYHTSCDAIDLIFQLRVIKW